MAGRVEQTGGYNLDINGKKKKIQACQTGAITERSKLSNNLGRGWGDPGSNLGREMFFLRQVFLRWQTKLKLKLYCLLQLMSNEEDMAEW